MRLTRRLATAVGRLNPVCCGSRYARAHRQNQNRLNPIAGRYKVSHTFETAGIVVARLMPGNPKTRWYVLC